MQISSRPTLNTLPDVSGDWRYGRVGQERSGRRRSIGSRPTASPPSRRSTRRSRGSSRSWPNERNRDFSGRDMVQISDSHDHWRSFWHRSAPGPPTSSCGGRRAPTLRKMRRSKRPSPPSSRQPAKTSTSASCTKTSFRSKSGRRSRPVCRPTSPLAWRFPTISAHGPTTITWPTSRTPSAASRTCSIRGPRPGRPVSTRRRARRLSMGCRSAARPITSTSGIACSSAAGFTLADTPRSGRRSGRSGATRSSPPCAGPPGRDDIWGVGLVDGGRVRRREDPVLPVRGCLPSRLRDRATAASSSTIRRSGRGSSRPSTATRPSTARAAPLPTRSRGTDYRNNERVLRPGGRHDAERDALDPERAQARAPRGLLSEHRDDRMAAWSAQARPFQSMGDVFLRSRLQGRRQRRHRQGVRPFPRGRGLARCIIWISPAERSLPPISKLLDQPFWLDPSDPHRMAAAMQIAS